MTARLILGVNGQDGILLSRLLHSKQIKTIGVGSQSSASQHIPSGQLYYSLDIRDTQQIIDLIDSLEVDIVYNLAGPSSVAESFRDPQTTLDVNYGAVSALLEAIYIDSSRSNVRFFQCSSSEMFGVAIDGPQNENTPFNPQSPYAEAKAKAHLKCQQFRNNGFFVSCGILFNHESIFRPETFVSRKVTSAVARIKLGLQESLMIGNLDARRDWGAAKDYVEAINGIVESDVADDFVIATGKSHSVRDLVTCALQTVGLESRFNKIVYVDQTLLRKSDLKTTIGDSSKIKQQIGWTARTSFEELISEMVEFDLKFNLSENQ
jgi:GDPmannose 4,6-dehydratase